MKQIKSMMITIVMCLVSLTMTAQTFNGIKVGQAAPTETEVNNDFTAQKAGLTDRELQEHQTIALKAIEKSMKTVKKDVEFFFWVTVIGIALPILAMVVWFLV